MNLVTTKTTPWTKSEMGHKIDHKVGWRIAARRHMLPVIIRCTENPHGGDPIEVGAIACSPGESWEEKL